MTIASLAVQLLADTTKLYQGFRDAEGRMLAFGSKLEDIGRTMTTAATLPIVAGLGFAVKAASDAEETFTKFAVVFRDVGTEADAAFQLLRDSYGLSSKAAKELLGNTGDLLTGFGFSQQAALDLATQVNTLAVDLASFTNFAGGAAGASDALTKALLGEREAVKSLGIAILEEDVQKKVAENTTKGLTFATERQAKAYATLQIAQEQSKNALGDYARTSEGFANQSRLLTQRLNDLAVEFGTILLPAMTKAVGVLTELSVRLREMDEPTKRLTLGVLGLVAVVGPATLAIGLLAKGVVALGVSMTTLTGPVGLLIVALGLLGAAFVMHNGKISEAESRQRAAVTASEAYGRALRANVAEMLAHADASGVAADSITEFSQAFDAMTASARGRAQALEAELSRLRTELNAITANPVPGNILNGFDGGAEKAEELRLQIASLEKQLAPLYSFLVDASGGMEGFRATTNATAEAVAAGTGDVQRFADAVARIRRELTLLDAQPISFTAEDFPEMRIETEPVIAPGSIAFVEGEIAKMQRALTLATSQGERDRIGIVIAGLQAQLAAMRSAGEQMNQTQAIAYAVATDLANQFTSSFGQGLTNVILAAERLDDVLRDIGKLLLSSAIQTALKLLLQGTSAFGVVGGSRGLFGGIIDNVFGSASPVGAVEVTGQFTLQGTDLVATIERSQRLFR